jgi:hypothetical protein
MADIKISIPQSLGLTEDQQKQLKERFQNTLVETLRHRADTEELAAARPKVKVVPEVVHPEVVVIVD